MEGVGARLGRSSTRYGPATVFSGPVRKWKKRWIPLATPNNNSAATAAANGNANGAARSHLVLYKWAPLASSPANGASQPDDPPPRKYRYVPVSVIEEEKQEAGEQLDETNELGEADSSSQPNQTDPSDTKPDMNDAAMEESQVADKHQASADDSNRANLDLNLGLKAIDGGETKSRNTDQDESGDQPEKTPPKTTSAPAPNRLKRKAATADLEMRV